MISGLTPTPMGSTNSAGHAGGAMSYIKPEDLDGALSDVRIRGESCDRFIAEKEKELQACTRKAKMFVKLTDGAGKSVLPIAIASLAASSWNPLCLIGVPVSIGVLATAFSFRNKLYQYNARLARADQDLKELQNMKHEITKERTSLERQSGELEWIKKAARVAQEISPDSGNSIAIDDNCVIIGGIRLERAKND